MISNLIVGVTNVVKIRKRKMKKNDSIHLKLTSDQKLLLKKRAESVGLSLSSYILFVLLNTRPQIQQLNDN